MDPLLYRIHLKCLWGVVHILNAVDLDSLCQVAHRIDDPTDRQLVELCCELRPKLPPVPSRDPL